MATYLMVHGAWHGAWCWYKVIPLLRAQGHRVIAPDLTGLGINYAPLTDVTLRGWVNQLGVLLEDVADPVVIVAHSRGGIVASALAEKYPNRIERIVYLAGMLLRNGETALGVIEEDGTSLMLGNVEVAADQSYAFVKRESLNEIFYGRTSDQDRVLANLLILPEPIHPSATPLVITEDRFGRVPRVYIETLQDKAIPLGLQRKMHTAIPCQQVFAIDSDHSPFFSQPARLAELLLNAAG